ncbi:MAG: DUF1232 domain-containing protein [Gomphosphaeria aponina SAG 52.96 = DSM 107014]|uniref:DUF1232 domain-containing protein n=1 Tax=Gomphosphaeria aponina SAG 52.96 = DSM 107014 TaxID=1521640 RepID=A0A941JTI6_9CHRO|nr:DUF1232 domain-containing protein [Gomphosphaeria aponina SAG 52.96 = DSM 107014]
MNISVQAIYNWYRNAIRNPRYRWWMVLGTLVYLISPIDIAPDFIPIVGQLDDIMILTLLISEVSQLLLDYMKQRQNKTATPSTKEEQTIEVEAVSVK